MPLTAEALKNFEGSYRWSVSIESQDLDTSILKGVEAGGVNSVWREHCSPK